MGMNCMVEMLEQRRSSSLLAERQTDAAHCLCLCLWLSVRVVELMRSGIMRSFSLSSSSERWQSGWEKIVGVRQARIQCKERGETRKYESNAEREKRAMTSPKCHFGSSINWMLNVLPLCLRVRLRRRVLLTTWAHSFLLVREKHSFGCREIQRGQHRAMCTRSKSKRNELPSALSLNRFIQLLI